MAEANPGSGPGSDPENDPGSGPGDDPAGRARALYGGPELAPLWRELWRRFSSGQPVGTVRLAGLDSCHRAALADLLGLDRLPPPEWTVRMAALAEVTAASVGLDPRAVTELLVGPLENRAARRTAEDRARRELWSWLEDHPVVRAQPALAEWATGVRRNGLIDRSPARTRALLTRALDVLGVLPSDGRPLSTFAGEVCGDTHALDEGTRLAGLVLRALAALHGHAPPRGAEQRRARWEQVGIACDALSTTVLTAGLRPDGNDPLASTLRHWSDAGHAAVVTLAQLRRFGPVAVGAPVVRVVENPAVLAMAVARFGARCPPLVTTSGWPNSATMLLLRHLAAAGARLDYHGDFDGEGLRIAAYVLARAGAPLAAVGRGLPGRRPPGPPGPGQRPGGPVGPVPGRGPAGTPRHRVRGARRRRPARRPG